MCNFPQPALQIPSYQANLPKGFSAFHRQSTIPVTMESIPTYGYIPSYASTVFAVAFFQNSSSCEQAAKTMRNHATEVCLTLHVPQTLPFTSENSAQLQNNNN